MRQFCVLGRLSILLCDTMFLICLTHDIDQLEHPFSSTLGLAHGLFNSAKMRIALRYLAGVASARKNPYDTYDRILDLEKKYGATSTFFVVPAQSKANAECLARLRAARTEVALHNIGTSYISPSELARQKNVIEKFLGSEISGVRSHRLDLMIPRTFEFQKHCGFKYDSSFFPPRYGNKRIYTPFPATDGLLELPLAFMDSDFQEMAMVGPDALQKTWTRIERILEDYRRRQGVCTILWHPTAFYDDGCELHNLNYQHFKGFDKLYEMILEYGSTKSDRMCGCLEAIEHWKGSEESMW